MFRQTILVTSIALLFGAATPATAGESVELQQIRKEIQQMKESYEARIRALESRLQQTESAAHDAQATATQAAQKADSAAAPPAVAAGANAFNPAIALILSGRYAGFSRDPANYRITGFIPGGEIGPGKRGFSLSETELGVYANVDPYLYGGLNFAVGPDGNTSSVEEAFVQTIGLGNGLTVKGGRFFSGIGYLNEQHAHTWDFADNPLAYQAFLGTQLSDDGVQLKWLAPTDTFIELGAELGRGRNFPGTDRNKNGSGAAALFGHAGGDVGTSSWRAGLSLLRTSPQDRQYSDTDLSGVNVTNSFRGDSTLWIGDFVWKWAPDGNPMVTNFKLQGEYFRRHEKGDLTYDVAGVSTGRNIDSYASSQSGGYMQGVYQFMPRWRTGLRADWLDSGTLSLASNGARLPNTAYRPGKVSLMFDYNPSEFSRFRLQFAKDKSRRDMSDNQMFLQYQMSLGAHGAHQF